MANPDQSSSIFIDGQIDYCNDQLPISPNHQTRTDELIERA